MVSANDKKRTKLRRNEITVLIKVRKIYVKVGRPWKSRGTKIGRYAVCSKNISSTGFKHIPKQTLVTSLLHTENLISI